MINDDAIEAYNTRLTATATQLSTMTVTQRDAVKHHGSKAAALLSNRDFVLFVHQFRFEVADALSSIVSHDRDSDARRIALSNQLAGIDAFVASLQRAVHMKNRVVSEQDTPAAAPRDTTKEVYKP